jgi:1-deoxy-D-xylulose-5-phosphate reductoisomerase
LRLSELGHLDFEEPRYDVFPALNLARRAGENGGVLPAILNAANEEAVKAFLRGRIPFPRIWSLVENAMEKVENFARPSLDDIMEADAKARAHVQGELEHH